VDFTVAVIQLNFIIHVGLVNSHFVPIVSSGILNSAADMLTMLIERFMLAFHYLSLAQYAYD
jgi:hypothetical protein